MIHDLGLKDRCQYSRSLLPWFRGQGYLARGHPSPVRAGAPCDLLQPAESPAAALRAGTRCVPGVWPGWVCERGSGAVVAGPGFGCWLSIWVLLLVSKV